jgi:hypothetical protein
MLRVSPYFSSGDQENERTVMGNEAVAEELAGLDELEALYELNASESDDEDEYDEDDEDEDDDEDDEDEDEDEDE